MITLKFDTFGYLCVTSEHKTVELRYASLADIIEENFDWLSGDYIAWLMDGQEISIELSDADYNALHLKTFDIRHRFHRK